MSESKSIKRFKDDLVKTLPFFPNNKETKEELLSQSVGSILFHYVHWALRFIPDRKRKIKINPHLTGDSRWASFKPDIEALFKKVRAGDDLTPHLSSLVHSKGYTPKDRISSGEADQWDDKDFLLNAMGFHHLHLGEGAGGRSDEVIFIRVTRDELHAIAIFDHSVFYSNESDEDEMTPERTRLWKIYDEITTSGMAPGTVYLSNSITTSGHPLHIHTICNQYTHILNEIDSKIEDRDFLTDIYESTSTPSPKNNKLRWCLNDLDLGLMDKDSNFFVLRYGPV